MPVINLILLIQFDSFFDKSARKEKTIVGFALLFYSMAEGI